MHAMFEEILRKTAEKARDEEGAKPRILPEAAIARLREVMPAYRADVVQFAPGDLVTPRRDATVKGTGEPHLVIDVLSGLDRHYRFDQGEAGSNTWGQLIDMRVLRIDGDRTVAYWVQSADFDTYGEPSRG